MAPKSQQLQIRLTPSEKRALKRLASAAGQDMSTYVLSRVLPPTGSRFDNILALLGDKTEQRYALAQLNDLLTALAPAEFRQTVAHAEVARLSPFLQNYVAAMIEQAAYMKGAPPPAWAARVVPLETPHFATPLKSLRLHLLRASPVSFKRRNIFVDATLGARV